jgi:hypothetical protein
MNQKLNTSKLLNVYLCIVSALLMLTGCESLTVPSQTPIQALPAQFQVAMPEVKTINSNNWDELAVKYIGLTGSYAKCVVERETLIKLWDKK